MMRSIRELIKEEREYIKEENSIVFPAKGARRDCCEAKTAPPEGAKEKKRVNLLALGDVGGTVLLGLKLEGGDILQRIGIYDLDPKVLRRYEREMNQITFPDGRRLPEVVILQEEELFDCDLFVFCASKGVPPVGAEGDVRMAQFQANRSLVEITQRPLLQRVLAAFSLWFLIRWIRCARRQSWRDCRRIGSRGTGLAS